LRRLLLFLVPLLLPISPSVAAALGTSGEGERLLGPNGVPMFATIINYEGPADRAWQMWENDKFDLSAIDADFGRAASAGARGLRIFVQAPLAADLAAGRWEKLDQVVGVAEKRKLQLIVSLHDYGERDLARVAATAKQIAQRYRGRPGILSYDLKNEPRFGDLALTRYPAAVPLQQRGLIDALGERLPRDQVADYRATDDGRGTVPASLSDDEAYIYVNNLRLYRDMLADAGTWVKQNGSTSLDYLSDPAGQKWAPLVDALNGTLQAWLQPQIDAVRAGDPGRPITVDHVDAILAKLPANDALDYETLHRYPGTGAGAVRSALSLIGTLQRAHPGKPYVLGEFGYATEKLDPDRAALHEVAIELGLLAQHAAGGGKWMLNDMPEGYNMRERTMGAFRLDGSPKPVVAALAALRGYLDAAGAAPGDVKLEDDPDVGVRYVYHASDALLLGGKQVDSGSGSLSAGGPAQLFLTWPEPGRLDIWASAPLQANVDLAQMLGGNVPGDLRLARIDGGKEQPLSLAGRDGARISLNLDKPGSYTLRLGSPPARAADYDIPNGHFFGQTNGRDGSLAGFSVTNADGIPFWDAFQQLGGVDVLGYPVTRRFLYDGFTVQAFQKAVLQWQGSQFFFLNTFDVLHDRGRDDWLETYRQTPRPFDTSPDKGLPWEKVVERHLALLDKMPAAVKNRFLADDQWLDHYGLPVSTAEYSNSIVVRAQRATFQYWKEAVPWAAKGDVTVANGGDLAKEAGLWPWLAVTPEDGPR
jgi:Cellulase (glycosyl hydrolase family 5)